MLQKKNPQQWRHLLPVKVVFQVLTPDRAIERSAGMITEDAGKRQVGLIIHLAVYHVAAGVGVALGQCVAVAFVGVAHALWDVV